LVLADWWQDMARTLAVGPLETRRTWTFRPPGEEGRSRATLALGCLECTDSFMNGDLFTVAAPGTILPVVQEFFYRRGLKKIGMARFHTSTAVGGSATYDRILMAIRYERTPKSHYDIGVLGGGRALRFVHAQFEAITPLLTDRGAFGD